MHKLTLIMFVGVAVSAYAAPTGRELCKTEFTNYENKAKKDPADEKAWKEFRVCVTELKRWHDGEVTAAEALKKNPNNAEAHLILGVARLHTKVYSKAAESLDDAIRLKPDNAQAYYYLGMTYLFQSMPLEASKAAERAVELDPKNPANYSQSAYAYYLLDDQPKSEAAAKKAVELDPNNVAAYKVLGNLYTKQGKTVEADAMFEEAIHANGRISAASPGSAKRVLPGMTTGVAGGVSGTAVTKRPAAVVSDDDEGPDPAQSRDEVETRLIIQWREMKDALLNGRVEKALTYYSDYEGTRDNYRKAFGKMTLDRLKQIYGSFSDLEDCEIVVAAATCSATISHSGTMHVTKVRFERGPDRVWRIRSY